MYGMAPIFSGDFLRAFPSGILLKWLLGTDVVQVEHPWQFEYAYRNKPADTPIVLVEHNIECQLFEEVHGNKSAMARKMLDTIRIKEQFALEYADIIFAMSCEERDRLVEVYSVDRAKVDIIPNGVDTSRHYPADSGERENAKRTLKFSGKKVVLFAGSAHPPNYEAIKEIIKIAGRVKKRDVIFLVAGSAGTRFKDRGNVLFTGPVDDISVYFKAADIAINPMMSGSGTNLKMLEYLASGLPVVTTKIGVRGIDVEDEKDLIISDIGDFPEQIVRLFSDEGLCNRLRSNARRVTEEKYDWKPVALKQITIYETLAGH
jgi:glycosyltransferase involved in cell wall biosynthesis